MSAYSVINPGMNRLLRSPLHSLLSGRIMTVSYRGRKSDKPYSTPVSYFRDGNTVYCFTNGSWRHNFSSEMTAKLRLKGKDYAAIGVVDDTCSERQVDIMTEYFRAVPQDKKFYGVRCDDSGVPVRAQVQQAARIVQMIRFELQA